MAPPVIAAYQARSGLEFALEVGTERLRGYSLERQKLMRSIFREAGVSVFEPSTPEDFGAFSLIPCDDAKRVVEQLASSGVTADARGRMIRFCPDILNSEEEFAVAAQAVAATL